MLKIHKVGMTKPHDEVEKTSNDDAKKAEATRDNMKMVMKMMTEDDFDVEDQDDMEKRELELEQETKTWVENEVEREERSGPTVSTMELNSFLLPRPDSRLNSFLELEEGIALQELWGGVQFGSDFGESIRRESQQEKKCDGCDKSEERDKVKEEEIEKMDKIIKGANKSLQAAEKSKKYLRDQVRKKEVEIEEVTLCWQSDVETNNAEITKITTELQVQKDMVLALKTERESTNKKEPEVEEGEVKSKKNVVVIEDDDEDDAVEVIKAKKFKCTLCTFTTINSKQLKRHEWRSHSQWRCSMCTHTSTTLEGKQEHLKFHREELDRILHRCDCCQKTFKNKEDVIKHKRTECVCQDCKKRYTETETVKEQVKEVHEAKEAPKEAPKEVQEEWKEVLCRNGSSCSWLRLNKCRFIHPQQPEHHRQPQFQPRQQQFQNR